MLKHLIAATLAIVMTAGTAQAGSLSPRLLPVTLSEHAPGASSGRLLVFAQPWEAAVAAHGGQPPTAVDFDFLAPGVAVAAQEITRIAPGETQWIDADRLAFPTPFSALKPGAYAVQVVLDVNHDYSYRGRAPDDAVSPVMKLEIGVAGPFPALELVSGHADNGDPFAPPAGASNDLRAAYAAARSDIDPLNFVSPSLSAFWGRSIPMRGWVVRPPGYDTAAAGRYPVVYWTHGFGEHLNSLGAWAVRFHSDMATGKTPPMIYVLLDESSATGTHEFADSANNGPWGRALTTELIPSLERRYRMDARPDGRFLTGHSSGGWATLWLQTRYPKIFGGTWSTAPDPSDFHDFVGADLYSPNANVYRRSDGTTNAAARYKGRVVATFEEFAKLERVMGAYGGQLTSFEWVFSPKGADGRPVPMFDRDTGAVDPEVVTYWRDHYDIAWRLARDWPTLKRDLDGKIHLIVGTADSYYLDGSARRLKAVLESLGAKAQVIFVEGRTHGNLYAIEGDETGLEKQIAWAMWAVARPASKLKPRP